MSAYDTVEEQVRQAFQSGDFDNLPGKGQPLNLSENPFAAGQETAFSLLHNNGFTPGWIEEKRQIEQELAESRSRLGRAWQRHDGSEWGQQQWRRAVAGFENEVAKLNQRVRTYNLKAPSASVHLLHLDAAAEIEAIRET